MGSERNTVNYKKTAVYQRGFMDGKKYVLDILIDAGVITSESVEAWLKRVELKIADSDVSEVGSEDYQ